jgi:hypothetical protein
MKPDSELKRFKDRLPIDVFNLHRDCAIHPETFSEIGEMQAEARGDMKKAGLVLEAVEAQVALEIRREPDILEKYNLKKLTEDTIKALIIEDERVKEAKENQLEAQRRFNTFSAMLSAWEIRGSLLKAEVSLITSKYFMDGASNFSADIEEQIASKRKDNST